MKLRIKKAFNGFTGQDQYHVQKRYLFFFWTPFGEDCGILYTKYRRFSNIADAQELINKYHKSKNI